MTIQTTYTEARGNFAKLCDRVTKDRDTVIITRRGAADVALIAADELASLEETAYLLRSPKNAVRLLAALRRALERTEKPQTLGALRQELGIAAKK
ncbi:MAG: type II toxin-antitoxin system prevent-host-death family antitoxin [Chloroflexi bacterium]|nr:type II toxin-antitoxin system prevent-host-death family antitoxin [Chloroflexota bacterium]